MSFRAGLPCGAWLVLALPAAAHVVSISTGEARVDGKRLTYELRMPVYEISHVQNPDRALLDHIRFTSSGKPGRMTEQNCAQESANYVCTATYEFPASVETLEIQCTYPSVTVPNHVHMLRASKGDKTDQAVFDASFTDAELRFRPPEPWEIAVRETAAGLWRAVAGIAPLLFLASLVLAGRNRRELAALTAMFLAGEITACTLTPRMPWQLSARFIEAAAALTIAYLAVEILLLPRAGQRWLVVGVLGLFHGLYFAQFLATSGYRLSTFFSGVAAAELLAIGSFALVAHALWHVAKGSRQIIERVLATVLLAIGLVWFMVRLKN